MPKRDAEIGHEVFGGGFNLCHRHMLYLCGVTTQLIFTVHINMNYLVQDPFFYESKT